jgi:hypothetical protein
MDERFRFLGKSLGWTHEQPQAQQSDQSDMPHV